MTGSTLFLVVVGVVFLTSRFFRVLDLIDRPARRPSGAESR